jgi:hypothetical protein
MYDKGQAAVMPNDAEGEARLAFFIMPVVRS